MWVSLLRASIFGIWALSYMGHIIWPILMTAKTIDSRIIFLEMLKKKSITYWLRDVGDIFNGRNLSPTSMVSNIRHLYRGYIDVDDGCWRPNMLMTSFGWWSQVTSPTTRVRLEHQISVTNIKFWRSKASLSHQHNDVTNITISDIQFTIAQNNVSK